MSSDQYDPYTGYDPERTQQWEGPTWDTRNHAQLPETGTAGAGYPQPQAQHPQQAQQPYQAYDPAQAQQQPYPQQAAYQPYPQAQAPQQPYQPMATGVRPQPVPEPQQVPETPQAAAPEAGAGYGPATVAGNARVTDAQRARLEGRSPIIEPGMQPALLTAVLGALLAVAAPLGSYALVVPLVVLQAVTAAGWFRLNGMWPARQGIALAFLGGLVADVAVLAAGRDHAPAAIIGPLAVWVILSLVLQLRSHASPDERMYGLMATVASSALTILATGYLGATADAVSVGAAAVAVAAVVRALPLPTPVSVVISLLAAAGAGYAVGGMNGLGTNGAVLGAAAAVCALIGHRAASYDYPSRFVHFTAGVALPLAAAGPVVWMLGRALG
ncbi:hypothetical protein GTW40_20760 [Streptomyces sp. SID4985]|uniref:hypothetical protein n=1 Tax=Streptomyces sp. SID4985 TaxID=2690292 RepID=UPI001370C29C|nr:hypothetical protein [Streptomyces sp. SID4985]MYQ47453.1 hypothetical protein [Streptomyces sp. SID4985]